MSKYKAVDALKNYLERQDNNIYAEIMQKAQKDSHFAKLVQSLTIDRLNGNNNSLSKNNIIWKV